MITSSYHPITKVYKHSNIPNKLHEAYAKLTECQKKLNNFVSMEKVYKSKVAKWYVWTCFGVVAAFIGTLFLCYQSSWILLIDVVFMGITVALMFDMLFHTDYTIKGDKLYIRCGVLFFMTLPIDRITEIAHKSTILSSPALSAKRIGIRYGLKNWVYISPKNQEDFISDIKSINPQITIS